MTTNPVDAVIAASGLGNDSALANEWGISRAAIAQFKRKGYLPLSRAQEAVGRWPSLRLRDLVKPEIRDAMDRA